MAITRAIARLARTTPRSAAVVLGGVLAAFVFAAAATAPAPQIVSELPRLGWEAPERELPELRLPRVPEASETDAEASEMPLALVVAITVVAVACALGLAAAAAGAVAVAWRNRPTVAWRRRDHPSDDFDVVDALDSAAAAAIAADATEQQAALRRGAPRNGIVECWMRLEAAVDDAGLPRRLSDTATETTQRVLAARAVDPVAIRDLSSLYREARFSSHPMGESDRRRAIAALDAVHAGIRASATAGPDRTPAVPV